MQPQPGAWQLIAENRIAEAIRNGDFDHLPGFGKPLDLGEADNDLAWLREKARREQLNLLPPALELARTVERRLAAIRAIPDDAARRAAIEALNEFIRAANKRILWGPPSTVQPISVDETGCADR